MIRRQESLVRLEYMLQIDNAAKPQVTVLGRPATFELALPRGVSDIEASYTRGPDPTPVTVHASGHRAAACAGSLDPGREPDPDSRPSCPGPRAWKFRWVAIFR